MSQKRGSAVLTTVLGTLTPDTAEEATTLIPSLNMDEEELQLILDELNKMRELEKINKMVTGL
jgi:DNA-directed RNA polymerase II subunit RPB4